MEQLGLTSEARVDGASAAAAAFRLGVASQGLDASTTNAALMMSARLEAWDVARVLGQPPFFVPVQTYSESDAVVADFWEGVLSASDPNDVRQSYEVLGTESVNWLLGDLLLPFASRDLLLALDEGALAIGDAESVQDAAMELMAEAADQDAELQGQLTAEFFSDLRGAVALSLVDVDLPKNVEPSMVAELLLHATPGHVTGL